MKGFQPSVAHLIQRPLFTRRTRVVAVALLVAAGLLPGWASAHDATSHARHRVTAGEARASNSQVVVAQGVDPTTMDPDQQRETTTVNVLRHMYDPLIERDASHPTTFHGVLATHWRRINPLVTQFTLRSGVRFSNGSPFNAQTVKYNIDRLPGKLPGSKPTLLAYQFTTVAGAKVVNSRTVDIITKVPDPLLLARLTELLMIPDHAVDKNPSALAATPDGTGPYYLVRWDRNNEVVMKAKKKYFLGPARIKTVIFKTLPDASSRLAALEAGTVDVITDLPPDNIRDAESTGKAVVRVVPSDRIAAVWLDTLDYPTLANVKVRQALNYAVDVNAIIKNVMDGYATRVATIVPPYFAGYTRSVHPYPYNPAKARALLAQAGYPHGFSMTLMVPQGRYLLATDIVQAIAGYLGQVGVRVKIDTVDFGVFAKATQTRHIPEAFYGAWGESFFDPLDMIDVAVVTGKQGFSWYSNHTVDKLAAEAASTTNRAKHVTTLQRIQAILKSDPPFIFLFAYKDLYGVSKRLDWKPRSDELIYMHDASVK